MGCWRCFRQRARMPPCSQPCWLAAHLALLQLIVCLMNGRLLSAIGEDEMGSDDNDQPSTMRPDSLTRRRYLNALIVVNAIAFVLFWLLALFVLIIDESDLGLLAIYPFMVIYPLSLLVAATNLAGVVGAAFGAFYYGMMARAAILLVLSLVPLLLLLRDFLTICL